MRQQKSSSLIIWLVVLVCTLQILLLWGFLNATSEDARELSPASHERTLGMVTKQVLVASPEHKATPTEFVSELRKVQNYATSLRYAWQDLGSQQGRVFPQAFPRRNPAQPNEVTMVVHIGVEKASRLLFSIRRWNGPVSVAIYISSTEDLNYIIKFWHKNYRALLQTDIHIYMEKEPWDEYPHNILRQLALDWCPSNYFLTLDVDFVTPPNASEHLNKQLSMNETLVSYLRAKYLMVLPAFDGHVDLLDSDLISSSERVTEALPDQKTKIKQFLDDKKLSPFHVEAFPSGHMATNYQKWFKEDGRSTSGNAFYEIDYACKFEPYVLGHKHQAALPKYWQGFRGFGFNKWTWLAEAYFSGFSFGVMTCDFCFVVHMKHARRSNSLPNYDEFKKWKKHFKHKYGWGSEQAEWILSDRTEIDEITLDGPTDMAQLVEWSTWKDKLLGRVFNSDTNADRVFVGTARVISGDVKNGSIVTSASGQRFYLSSLSLT